MRARQVSCSFTGHRPEKLPWGDNEADMRCGELKKWLLAAVLAAYEQGFRHFLCGMAQGCDLYFCEAVLALLYLLAYPLFFVSVADAWNLSIPFAPAFFVLAGIVFLIYDYAFSKVMAMLQSRLIPLLRQRSSGH